MIINNNIPALNTFRQLGVNQNATQSSMEKLSSGLRINRAGDDAAGLAISEKMRGQIRGLDQASRNSQDGISLIQTAEGALNETHNILQRMRELAVQAANDTNTDEDREELQKEVDQLIAEIDRISDTTEFNTKNLLNGDLKGARIQQEYITVDNNDSTVFGDIAISGGAGNIGSGKITEDRTYNIKITEVNLSGSDVASYSYVYTDSEGTALASGTATTSGIVIDNVRIGINIINDTEQANSLVGQEVTFTTRQEVVSGDSKALSFQVGANSSQTISVDIGDMSASALHVDKIDLTSSQGAQAAISAINNAIEDVSSQRSDLGAYQNRLEHTIANLDNAAENLQAAESRIRDVDMAREMMEMTRANILSQASQSMLAQANQQPQSVLQLLG